MQRKRTTQAATPVTITVGPSHGSYPLGRESRTSAQTTVPTTVAGSTHAQWSDCCPRRHRATAPAPAVAATAGAMTTV